jgi:hypothetical protein
VVVRVATADTFANHQKTTAKTAAACAKPVIEVSFCICPQQ